MTTGEGGMVVTNKKFINKIIQLKSQGLNINKNNNYYNHEIIGFNYRMTNICAAIGLAQLKKINFLLIEKTKLTRFIKKYY